MRSPRRTYLFLVAALAAVVVLALLWLSPETSDDAGDHPVRTGAAPVEGPERPRAVHAAPAPAPDGPAVAPARAMHRLDVDAPAGAHPIIWVLPGERVAIRTEPGSGDLVEVVGRRTEFGSPTVFGVVRTSGRWGAVSTPALGNDRLGWVRLDSRRLDSGWTELSIVVSLSGRRAELREGDEVVRSFPVTIGAPGSETPTGRFAVTDTFRGGLNPVYGCCAVAISAIQPDLPSGWLGGNRIAFHGNGTGEPLGIAASNGCLRADDRHVDALVEEVGLGTPVFVRS